MSLEFLITTLIIVATPGTGALYTLACAISGGTHTAVIGAFGCTLGIVPHMAAAALGLAAVVATNPQIFEIIRLAGIAYLLWMAISLWRSDVSGNGSTGVSADKAFGIIRKAVLINLLNPKLSLFFLAFLPQFIAPADPAPLLTMTALGLVFMAITFAVFAVYGVTASSLRSGLINRPRRMQVVNRLLAGGFIVMAGKLALAQR